MREISNNGFEVRFLFGFVGLTRPINVINLVANNAQPTRLSLKNNTQFSSAIHILVFLERFKTQRLTSQMIASSVGTNAVVVRRVLTLLKTAGLVTSQQGPRGGFALGKAPQNISLFEVHRAVLGQDARTLFAVHENPRPECPIGSIIHAVLTPKFLDVQTAMDTALGQIGLDAVMDSVVSHQKALSKGRPQSQKPQP